MADNDALNAPLTKDQQSTDPFFWRGNAPKGSRHLWMGLAVGSAFVFGLFLILFLAAKPITGRLIEDNLAKQGVYAKIKVLDLSFDQARAQIKAFGSKSASISGSNAQKPEFQIDQITIRYHLKPWAHEASRRFVIQSIHVRGLDITINQAQKGWQVQAIDPLVKSQDQTKSNSKIDLIVIEEARLKLRSDMGLIQAKGGLSLRNGALDTLNLQILPAALEGANGQARLREGHLKARQATDKKINIDIRLVGEMAYHSSSQDPLAPSQDAQGDLASLLAAQDFVIQAAGSIPSNWEMIQNRHSGQAILAPQGGAGMMDWRIGLRAKGLQTELIELNDFEAQSQWLGTIQASNAAISHGYSWEGNAQVSGRASRVNYQNSDAKSLGFTVNARPINAQISLSQSYGMPSLSLTSSGDLSSEIEALRLDDLYARQAKLGFASWDLRLGTQGLRLSYQGSASAAKLGVKDLALSQLSASLDGLWTSETVGVDQITDHEINLSFLSPDGQYSGLNELGNGLKAAQSVLPAEPDENTNPITPNLPDHPLPAKGPDGIIALDRAFERFSLRAKGVRISQRRVNQAPPLLRIGLLGSVEADFVDGGRLRISPRGDVVLVSSKARSQDGLSLSLSGPTLPVIAMDIGEFALGQQGEGIISGWFDLNASGNFANFQGLTLKAKGHFSQDAVRGLLVQTPQGVDLSARHLIVGDSLDNLDAHLSASRGPLIVFDSAGLRLNAKFHDLSAKLSASGLQLNDFGGNLNFKTLRLDDRSGYEAGLSVEKGLVSDAIDAPARFYNMTLLGSFSLNQDKGGGRFYLTKEAFNRPDSDTAWVKVDLKTFDKNQAGSLKLETPVFSFTDEFTPADLTPLMASIAPREAKGTAQFQGSMAWGCAISALIKAQTGSCHSKISDLRHRPTRWMGFRSSSILTR